MSEAVGGLDLDTQPELDHETGDHDRFSHYVTKEDAMKAYVDGVQVTALCGKKWIPSRDPERFPVCPVCKDLYGLFFGND
jgi:hypothetical protein